MKQIRVGIIGFGTVGAGVVDGILRNGELIAERTGVHPVLAKVADLDITTDRGVTLPPGVLTTDVNEVLLNPEVDVVVELVGGTGVARQFVLTALSNGKPVVTANKALLATHGVDIFNAAEWSSADIYYEASVGGGIPCIKAIREGLVANRFTEILGILNGTCNYILSRMEADKVDFDVVLREAQAAGYAEADPSFDIDGIDTAHKATILASLAYGEWFGMEPLHIEGIRSVTLQDIEYADVLGYRIKLLAVIKAANGAVQMRVQPSLIPKRSLLGHVNGVYNAVCVLGDLTGATMYYGRGAGRDATASAVIADIVDVGLNLAHGAHRRIAAFRPHHGFERVVPLRDISTRYYIRVQALDRPGAMALVSGILGRRNISIASVTQKEVAQPSVPMVILTHQACEAAIQDALREMGDHEAIVETPVVFRIEDLD